MQTTWSDAFVLSLQNIWVKIVSYFPQILGAVLVFIAGLLISATLGKFAKKLFKMTKLDVMNDKLGLKDELRGLGMKFEFSDLIGWVVKWFFIIITLIAVVDVLQIPQVTRFLEDVALYIPNVVVAIIILSIGLVAGKLISDISDKALRSSYFPDTSARFLASATKWSIVIFALMASLVQMGVAANLIQILFTGVVIMFALAGGLAFGLGGRDKAARIISRFEDDLKKSHEAKEDANRRSE